MNIFNSLGSNYDLRFVRKALTAKNNNSSTTKLKQLLEKKYQGEVTLVYKGREAIELALRSLRLPQDTTVACNGYTCYAVYKAVTNAGFTPEYIDIPKDGLDFSAESFKKSLKSNPAVKVLLIQNTLGYPCDIETIIKICKEEKIILIEDLAHSIGTHYENGREAGTVGDFTVLSFSQDKMIDGISGGALIVRDKELKATFNKISLVPVAKKQQNIDRFYPLFTFLIRKTYRSGLGKIVHEILKRLQLLSNPMTDQDDILELPSWYCQIISSEFVELEKNLTHRKSIASIYAKSLNKSILYQSICNNVQLSSNLRFPIFVSNREKLIKYLKQYGVYISDIWYDAPIAPKKYMKLTKYKDECPQAESLSEQMLNLPTHKNISEKDAKEISQKINLWLTLQ